MNINDWKTIQARNDIKYIKRKLIGSSTASWSLVIDIFLLLLAFVLDQIHGENNPSNKLWVIIAICGVTIPLVLFIIEIAFAKRRESISRKVTNARELVSLFDDEICYMIMSSETFLTSLKANMNSVDDRQKALLQEFYFIEAGYYLNKSVKLLLKLDNNFSIVIDDDDLSRNRLSKTRINNAIRLIVSVYEDLFLFAKTQTDQLSSFSIVLDRKTMQDCYQSLRVFVADKSQILAIDVDKTFKYNFKNTSESDFLS